MARAGFCAECSAVVWLHDDGRCQNGHAASSVSGAYDSAVPVQSSTTSSTGGAPRPKRQTGLIVAVALAVSLPLACLVVGILVAIAIPVFNASASSARTRQCFSQERVMEGAIQQRIAMEPDAPALPDWPAAVAAVVPGYLKVEPVCPTGGAYSLVDGQRVECSAHGSFRQSAP